MKVLIAIPTFENILPDTFKSVYGLEVPEGTNCQFDFCKGYDCAKARNNIAQEAIQYGFDYLLTVDSDMIIPRNALTSMLSRNTDVCLGVYPRKNTKTEQTEIFALGQKDFTDSNNMSATQIDELNGQAVEIKGGGLGCALIKVGVFEKIAFPWFKYVQYDNGAVLSEDNYFCTQVRAAGLTVMVDSAVRCGHSVRGFQWR